MILDHHDAAAPFLAVYPWDLRADELVRQERLVDPAQNYPLAEQNRELLIELGTVYGREGYDFQNPYVWAGRGVLQYPLSNGPELDPRYGMGTVEPADVALNIRATQGALHIDSGWPT